MAMCFAILGLKVPGIKIWGTKNPACVKEETFPNFFQKLAALRAGPLSALGATILEISEVGHSTR